MKKSISILCTAYVLGTGLASAATAIIDFGPTGTTTSYSNPIRSNILQADAVTILTTTGTDPGWHFAQWVGRDSASDAPSFSNNRWDGKTDFENFIGTLDLPAGVTDFNNVWQDGINLRSGSGNLTFSGLVAGHTYTISLGMGRSDWQNQPNTMTISTSIGTLASGSWFMSNGNSGNTALESFTNNMNQALASYNIVADEAGKIQIGITNSDQFVALQFATISDSIPEPASAALILFGLPALSFRRRRKH